MLTNGQKQRDLLFHALRCVPSPLEKKERAYCSPFYLRFSSSQYFSSPSSSNLAVKKHDLVSETNFDKWEIDLKKIWHMTELS